MIELGILLGFLAVIAGTVYLAKRDEQRRSEIETFERLQLEDAHAKFGRL